MGIDTVNLGRIDLNLLVHLDALLTEKSVTRAAARVGIGQSAMSHNLARLRELFGDELLTRGIRWHAPHPTRDDATRASAGHAGTGRGAGVTRPGLRFRNGGANV